MYILFIQGKGTPVGGGIGGCGLLDAELWFRFLCWWLEVEGTVVSLVLFIEGPGEAAPCLCLWFEVGGIVLSIDNSGEAWRFLFLFWEVEAFAEPGGTSKLSDEAAWVKVIKVVEF